MNRWAIVFVGCVVTTSMDCLAQEPVKAPRSRLMIMLETKFIEGRKLQGSAEEYVHDDDRNTIELVALPKEDPGPSRVSSDGQVLFLCFADLRSRKANDALMEQAFDILEKKEAESAKTPPASGNGEE